MTTPDEYQSDLAKDPRFGPDVASLIRRLMSHPRYGRYLRYVPYQQRRAVPGALRALAAQLRGEAPLHGLAAAITHAAGGALQLLPLRRIMPGETTQRAATNEPGLVAAAAAFLAVAERLDRSIPLPFSLEEVRLLVVLIRSAQGALDVLTSAGDRLFDNLALWETRLLSLMREYAPYLAAVAAADEDQRALMDEVRGYLSGPAVEGASTRRARVRTLADLTEQAKAAGQALAQREARAAVSAEFKSLLEAQLGKAATPAVGGDGKKDPAP